MWDTVRQWLHTLPVREEVVESVLMVMALLILRGVLQSSNSGLNFKISG